MSKIVYKLGLKMPDLPQEVWYEGSIHDSHSFVDSKDAAVSFDTIEEAEAIQKQLELFARPGWMYNIHAQVFEMFQLEVKNPSGIAHGGIG